MEKADDELVSPPAAYATTITTAMPISTALSLTASSSPSNYSGYTTNNNDVVGVACLCPTAANGGAPAGRHALEQEMLYRVDLQLQSAASAWTTGGDRRKKRMIKNRESAARSRARKQAYMHELEKEVHLLRAENDALREQCEELKGAVEVPVKKTLQRVSSAPF